MGIGERKWSEIYLRKEIGAAVQQIEFDGDDENGRLLMADDEERQKMVEEEVAVLTEEFGYHNQVAAAKRKLLNVHEQNNTKDKAKVERITDEITKLLGQLKDQIQKYLEIQVVIGRHEAKMVELAIEIESFKREKAKVARERAMKIYGPICGTGIASEEMKSMAKEEDDNFPEQLPLYDQVLEVKGNLLLFWGT